MKEIKKEKMIAGIVIGAVILAGVSFYGGARYDQSKNPTLAQGSYGGAMGQNGVNGARVTRGGMASGATGQILSNDGKSLTVSIRTGGSKIVLLSQETQVMKTIDGTPADLTKGENVVIQGTPNSDGSITAEIIQIRPAQTPGMMRVNSTGTAQ